MKAWDNEAVSKIELEFVMPHAMKISVVLVLTWIGVTSAAVLLFLAEGLPLASDLVRPDALLIWLLLVELLFVLFAWPFLLLRIVRTRQTEAIVDKGLKQPQWMSLIIFLMGHMVVLVILALPLALIGMTVAGSPLVAFLKGQVMVFLWACAVASFLLWGMSRHSDVKPWYFWLLLTLSSVPPLLYYFMYEYQQTTWDFLIVLSPVWSLLKLESTMGFTEVWVFQAGALILLSILCLATMHRPPAVKVQNL